MLGPRIAGRYLVAKKSHAAVNVISAISLAAVAVAAAAMVVVLSVFNGFEQLALAKLSNFAPPYLMVAPDGAMIADAGEICRKAEGSPAEGRGKTAVASTRVYPRLESMAFAVSDNGQGRMAVKIVGMTPDELAASGIHHAIVDGVAAVSSDSSVIVGVGPAMQLGVRAVEEMNSLTVYEPRRIGRINPANPMAGFRRARARVAGVFQTEDEEHDCATVIVPYAMAENLLSAYGEASSLAVYPAGGASPERLKRQAEELGLRLLDRVEQEPETFRMINVEKWITFVMLAFILAIASANIISTMSMIVIEKRRDMDTLSDMGAPASLLRGIFTWQGWMIAAGGGLLGATLGCLMVWGQATFGWIKLGSANPQLMSITVYPVVLRGADVALTLAAILVVAMLLTLPIRALTRR